MNISKLNLPMSRLITAHRVVRDGSQNDRSVSITIIVDALEAMENYALEVQYHAKVLRLEAQAEQAGIVQIHSINKP